MKRGLNLDCARLGEQLTAYHLGELTARETEIVRRHLETCEACQTLSRDIAATLDLTREALTNPVFAPHATGRLSAERRKRVMIPVPKAQWKWDATLRLAALFMLATVGLVALVITSSERSSRMARRSKKEFESSFAAAEKNGKIVAQPTPPELARTDRDGQTVAAGWLQEEGPMDIDRAAREAEGGSVGAPVLAMRARRALGDDAADRLSAGAPLAQSPAIVAAQAPDAGGSEANRTYALTPAPAAIVPTAEVAESSLDRLKYRRLAGDPTEDHAPLRPAPMPAPPPEAARTRGEAVAFSGEVPTVSAQVLRGLEAFSLPDSIFREIDVPYPEAGENAIVAYPALVRAHLPPHRVWLCVGLRIGDVPPDYFANVAVVLDTTRIKSVRAMGHSEKMSSSAPLEIGFDSLSAGQSRTVLFELEWPDRTEARAISDAERPVAKVLVRHGNKEGERTARLAEIGVSAADWTERGAGHAASAPHRLAVLAAEFMETLGLEDKTRREAYLRLLARATKQMVAEMPGSGAAVILRDRVVRAAGLPVE